MDDGGFLASFHSFLLSFGCVLAARMEESNQSPICHHPFPLQPHQRPTTNSPSGQGEGEGIVPLKKAYFRQSVVFSALQIVQFQKYFSLVLGMSHLFRRRASSYKLHVTLPTALSWESPWLHIHPPQKLTTPDRFFSLIGWPLSPPSITERSYHNRQSFANMLSNLTLGEKVRYQTFCSNPCSSYLGLFSSKGKRFSLNDLPLKISLSARAEESRTKRKRT